MPSGALRVTFFVLNLRMGGQVSNLKSLETLLTARGVPVRWALPEGLRSLQKAELVRFAELDPVTRAWTMWQCLRRLPNARGDVVHMVVPTPSFTPVCLMGGAQSSRIVVQSEGLPTAFDRDHVTLLGESPRLMLPRMLLNHRQLVRSARHLRVAQLVTAQSYAAMLRELGYRDVSCIENVARFSPSDELPLPDRVAKLLTPDRTVIGYIGHAHAVKGVDDLLEAFVLASVTRFDLTLVLALSSDGSAERLVRRAQALPAAVCARIHFVGMVPVSSLLRRLDVLVLPYRSIATTTIFPSLLLEGDLAGCPMIVSEVAPLPDILPTSPSAHVRVPARSPAALAGALREVLPRRLASAPSLRLPSESERVDRLLTLYGRLAAA